MHNITTEMNNNEARSAKFRERCRSENGFHHPVPADFLALRTLSWPDEHYVHRDSARQAIGQRATEVDRDIERGRKDWSGTRACEERRGSTFREASSVSNGDEREAGRNGALGVPDVLHTVSETYLPSKRVSVSKHSKQHNPSTIISKRNSGNKCAQTSIKNGHSKNSEYNRDNTSIMKQNREQSKKSRDSSHWSDNGSKQSSDKNISIKKPSKSADGNHTSNVSKSDKIHKKKHSISSAPTSMRTSKSALVFKEPISPGSSARSDVRLTVSRGPPRTCTKKRLKIALGVGVSVLSLSLIVATVVATQFNSSAGKNLLSLF